MSARFVWILCLLAAAPLAASAGPIEPPSAGAPEPAPSQPVDQTPPQPPQEKADFPAESAAPARQRPLLSPRARESYRPPRARTRAQQFDVRAASALQLAQFESAPWTNRVEPEWRLPPTQPFTLGPTDVIEIQLLGPGSAQSQALIGPDGKIYFHLLPGLDVWGLTLDQTRDLLERELQAYLRIRPQISVSLRSIGSKKVWLLGRLNAPGIYPLGIPMTLLEALATAGGPISTGGVDLADLQNAFLIRKGQRLPVDFERLLRSGDMSQNIYLQPDDFLYLPSAAAQEIYVLGAVRQPLSIPYRHEVTLMTALASVGGPASGAYLSHVAIVRGSLSDPKIAIVNFNDILRGRATDILLEPRDIVFVPNSPFQFLGKYLAVIINSFITTIATNAGVQAVVPDAAPVGVGTVPTVQ